jgi:diguanylate cyclase (GGDEF)-like protein/PAS domain S-box-containing protein
MVFILASYAVFIVYLYLGYLVHKINSKGIYNRLFVIICILFAMFSLLELIKFSAHSSGTVILAEHLSRALWQIAPALLLDLSLYITQKEWHAAKRKNIIKYIYTPGIVFALHEMITTYFIKVPAVYDVFRRIELISLYSYTLICLYLFLKRYITARVPAEKKSMRILLLYGVSTVALTAFNDFFLVSIDSFFISFNQFIIFFFFIGVFYINYRYKFFELSSLITAEDIVDNITEMVLLVDTEGGITGANRRAEKVLGYKLDSLIGSRLDKVTNLDFSSILRKIYTCISYEADGELCCTNAHGEKIPVSARISVVKANHHGGIAGIIVILTDKTLVKKLQTEIKERIKRETQLCYMGTHDFLTGMYNRAYFSQVAQTLQKEHGPTMGVIMCDLDGLKLINDAFGQDMGDKLLVDAASIINSSLDGNAIACRMGGDEFVILIPNCTQKQIGTICGKIRSTLKRYNAKNNDIPLSISMGYALCCGLEKSVEELFKEADNYMYREKLYNTHSIRNALVQALTKTLEARDFITEGHGERMKEMAIKLGKHMGLSEQRILDLQLLAQFHDLGKVGVPDSILFKPSSLTEIEIVQIQRHCEIGYKIAQAHPDLINISDLILRHHERWDGKGYPLGIEKEEIPLECRILAIIDAYDAMVNDRPYRKGMNKKDAVTELVRNSGSQFDPRLVQKFLKMFGSATLGWTEKLVLC